MAPQQKEVHDTNSKNCSDITVAPHSKTLAGEIKILWRNVIIFSMLHVAAVYGAYLFFFRAMCSTCFFNLVIGHIGAMGITAGVHRLWSHRSYKARMPLQIILVYLNTMAMQFSVLDWARDHRLHHKYSETNADPHNAKRGFFFAHIGWLLVQRHPELHAKASTIEMSDLTGNPLLTFQHRYYLVLALLTGIVIPTCTPTLWGESLSTAFFVWAARYTYSLHATWLVNSAAHLWDYSKPYDRNIKPVDIKTVSVLTLGEGFHNYHHTFPSDYKTAELGYFGYINSTTMFIDLMAKIGWAYDLKTMSQEVIYKRVKRSGDGSHNKH